MKQIIVFDLDGTLLRGDSFIAFLLGFLKHKPMLIFRVLHLPIAVLIHAFGIRSNTWLKITFLRAFLGGYSRIEVECYAKKFVDILIRDFLRSAALKRVQEHQRDGDFVVLATASPDIYVRHFAEELLFDKVVCTELTCDKGRITGSLRHGNCYGSTKLQFIKDSLGHSIIDVAYSDHDADLPLLRSAKRAIAVNPNKRLALFAADHGIVIENWEEL